MRVAPVALFAYNRVEHLRRTLAALAVNPLARNTEVFAFSDAPKRPEHANAVAAVRALLASTTGFAHVHVIERDRNLGLAASIIDGVDRVCESAGRVIVVEDDLVLAPEFLDYMNRGLDRYMSEPRVMSLSGYMYPLRRPEVLPNTFFLRLPTSWGWATWDRAWRYFERDAQSLLDRMKTPALRYAFDLDGSYPYFDTLARQALGKLDVWGVRWYASVFLRDGLCLYPARSLVHNAGMDGSGVHCGVSSDFDVDLAGESVNDLPSELKECGPARDQVIEFYRSLREPLLKRVVRRLGRRLLPALGQG